MLTRRSIAALIAAAVAFCACVPSHYTPVAACPVGADGKHPSSGPLLVLPSEVPDVQLDSMRWQVHTGHEGEEFGTWTSVSASGRIVSTKQTSLVGVGVLVEGMRGGVVVLRMIDSSFYEVRQDSPQSGTLITRETVRPDRPVPVGVGDKDLTDTPPSRWGCPTQARIIHLYPPGTPLRAPRRPEDELPSSNLYAWNPWTFSVDTVMRLGRGRIVLLRGPEGETARTDVVVVRSKSLYRRFDREGVRADSSRLDPGQLSTLGRQTDSVVARGVGPTVEAYAPTPVPNREETILMIGVGARRYEWRFPTGSPPPDLAPIVRTLTEMGDELAPDAELNPRPNRPL